MIIGCVRTKAVNRLSRERDQIALTQCVRGLGNSTRVRFTQIGVISHNGMGQSVPFRSTPAWQDALENAIARDKLMIESAQYMQADQHDCGPGEIDMAGFKKFVRRVLSFFGHA